MMCKYKFLSILALVIGVVLGGVISNNTSAISTPVSFRELRSQLISPDLLNRELTLNHSNDLEDANNDDVSLPSYNLSDSDLALLADTATTYADNNLSLEIGGQGLNEAVKTLPGQVAYRAHTVKVTSSNIKSYTLTINGPVGLKNANASSTTSNNTITGAGGKTPTNMANNSWGYAYNQSGNNGAMTYSSFTGSNQQLEKASSSPNFTKNLVFAAKFDNNAEAGHYQATVKLSLTATPKVITTYTLSYNANSGSNAPDAQTYTDDTEAGSHTFTISSSKPTRSGYEFSSWNTNSSGTGTNYDPGGTITLSASSPTQTLYAKWAQIYTRTLSYNMNGGTDGPSSQSCSSTSTSCSITISSTKPTKTNYVFAGWSTSSSATSASYQPGSSITLSSNTTLYAVWRVKTLADITTMQELYQHPEICTNTQLISGQKYSAEYTLTDDRTYPSGTDKTYKVRKFADGRCWMTENLRIYNTTIQASQSDFASGSITLPSSSASDFVSDNRFSYRSILISESSAGSTGYYNWYTATAGAGDSSVNTNGQDVDTSICPKGWKLPSGARWSSDDEFSKFTAAESIEDSSVGSTKIQAAPYNFKFTGAFYQGRFYSGTSLGAWWTNTVHDGNNANYFRVNEPYVGVVNVMYNYGTRHFGFAVRCIARDS